MNSDAVVRLQVVEPLERNSQFNAYPIDRRWVIAAVTPLIFHTYIQNFQPAETCDIT